MQASLTADGARNPLPLGFSLPKTPLDVSIGIMEGDVSRVRRANHFFAQPRPEMTSTAVLAFSDFYALQTSRLHSLTTNATGTQTIGPANHGQKKRAQPCDTGYLTFGICHSALAIWHAPADFPAVLPKRF